MKYEDYVEKEKLTPCEAREFAKICCEAPFDKDSVRDWIDNLREELINEMKMCEPSKWTKLELKQALMRVYDECYKDEMPCVIESGSALEISNTVNIGKGILKLEREMAKNLADETN